jgi:hypothetical protein
LGAVAEAAPRIFERLAGLHPTILIFCGSKIDVEKHLLAQFIVPNVTPQKEENFSP